MLFFIVFLILIAAMLALDLGVFHKKDHIVGIKEAVVWTGIWIGVALLFGLVLLFKAEWIHGITDMAGLIEYSKSAGIGNLINPDMGFNEALKIYRKEVFEQYIAGYFLEKSLSVDNIFVMLMVFISFGIDKIYYHRVLFWGILVAIVLRFVFIFGLGMVVSKFSWVLAIFGIILIVSGIKLFKGDDDEQIDTENHPVVRFASKHFRVTPKLYGDKFFTMTDIGLCMTPLMVVLLVIEFSDIVFAVDSIPAAFSVTTDPYIIYFSNIFAIMGLRSLFFVFSGINDKFWVLRYGLGVLLTFVGVKMIGHEFFGLEISTTISLFVILGILFGSILLSLIWKKKDTDGDKR